MLSFTTTFARTLAILATASLMGCDDVDDLDIDDIDDIDDIELRDDPLPIANIPFVDPPVKLSFSIPMQPVAQFKPKSGFSLHGATDLAYVWTPDPTGAPDTILVDANGVSPYSADLPFVPESVCEDFLEVNPYYVPIHGSTASCAQVEHGCCDRICYLWGGVAAESNGANMITAVSNDTFTDTEMVWGSYVQTARMTWNMNAPNGGHSSRETVCGCRCEIPE